MKVLKIDIDFDAPEWWRKNWIQTRLEMLKSLGWPATRIKEVKTTKGYHYFIHLDQEVNDELANMLQFLMGDDHTRVKINAWRIGRGVKHWNKMFDRKLYRKDAKTIDCWYCGNKIMIPKEILKNGKTHNGRKNNN